MNDIIVNIDSTSLSQTDIEVFTLDSTIPKWKMDIYIFILKWFDNSDFIIQKTSGSTGRPKEIRLKKSAMVASAKKTINYFQLQKNQNAWLCLPIEYIAGKMMVVRAIVGNLNLLLTPPLSTPIPQAKQIDFAALVPMQLKKMLDANQSFLTIKKLIVGGAFVEQLLEQSIKTISTKIYATYGMTETCSHIAIQRLNGYSPDENFKLLDGITISTDKEGRLQIDAPELCEEVLQTNDLVNIVSPKEFKLVGRTDNVINSGGVKIYPEIIERKLNEMLKRECILIPVNDNLLGQKLVLAIEGNEFETASVLQYITSKFGRIKTPKKVKFVPMFPRNGSMKIDRKVLTRLFNE